MSTFLKSDSGNRPIWILVNPISGGKDKRPVIQQIEKEAQKLNLNIQLHLTQSKAESIQLAQQAIAERASCVVAAGGDGTINDIASVLVHSNIPLGIIPLGSGNGLSRELGIPMQPKKALQRIAQRKIRSIDTGEVNNLPFMNIAGLGFDAHIAGLFEKANRRGFWGYFKLILRSYLQYTPQHYRIITPTETLQEKAFMLAICNGKQFGNNAWIGPKAKLDDGFLDLSLIKRAGILQLPGLVWRMFGKSIHKSSHCLTKQASTFTVVRPESGLVNIDGEPVWLDKNLNFKILPSSLQVIC